MQYLPLYTIEIEHTYFRDAKCRAVELRMAQNDVRGAELFRRRGLLLRRRDVNIWDILYDKDGSGVDTKRDALQLDLVIVDRDFSLYTLWADYDPNALYSLDLPVKGAQTRADKLMRNIGMRKGVGTSPCSILIRMTDSIIRSAQKGQALRAKLQFEAPKKLWEYILIPHDENKISALKDGLAIEVEGSKELEFSSFEDVEIFEKKALRALSRQMIEMRENYGFSLNIVVRHQGENRTKQTLRRDLEHPNLIQFQSKELNLLTRVCSL